MKDEPGHQRGCRTFERQEKGRRRGVGTGQSGHKQDGTRDPASANRSCQPWDVFASKDLLSGRLRPDGMGEAAQDRHTNTRPAVKQSREHDGSTAPMRLLAAGVEMPNKAAEASA